jgi:hypothetical protein
MFDRDKENGVVTLGANVSETRFYLSHVGIEAPPAENKTEVHKPWFATMLKHTPETRLMYPKVDSDQNVVTSQLYGDLHRGGLIQNESSVFPCVDV